MRRRQSPATKGSQYHLQRLINDPADPLGDAFRQQHAIAPEEVITWLSPLANDDFAEYGDEAFLTHVGLHPERMEAPLKSFWPSRGPQWDALARTRSGQILLVEGKSHRSEMRSRCTATSPQSLATIQRALEQTSKFCRGDVTADWTAPYYQYANRLAFLYWLKLLNGVNAHLMFVYFVDDRPMRGPTSVEAWQAEIAAAHQRLGLPADPMPGFVHHVFYDV